MYIYLFGDLCRFQHCTGHITTGIWEGRGNQYIQLVKVLYCKLLTNSKQLPPFPLEVGLGTELRPQRWEARVLPLFHHGTRYSAHDHMLMLCPVTNNMHYSYYYCNTVQFLLRQTTLDCGMLLYNPNCKSHVLRTLLFWVSLMLSSSLPKLLLKVIAL